MFDFNRARTQMVDSQIRTNDVTDHRVLDAFLRVPRETFVPRSLATLAYMDDEIALSALPGGDTRYVMEPRVLGRMVQALDIRPGDAVLVVGCGSGYSAAILAHLAESVIAVESSPDHAEAAVANMDSLDLSNVVVMEGSHEIGYAEQAPYDAILIDGAVDMVPESLVRQVANGAHLVAVQGRSPYGRAVLFTHSGGVVSSRALFDANARLLPGFAVERAFEF